MVRLNTSSAISTAVIALGLCGSVSNVRATTLYGDVFDVSLNYPNRATKAYDFGNYKDNNKYTSLPFDPNGRGKLGPRSIRYMFGQTFHFKNAHFYGLVFKDETAPRIAKVTLDKATNAMGLTASDLTFSANSIWLNLAGITVHAGTVIQLDVVSKAVATPMFAALSTPTVPLPAAAPMFGAALLAFGAVGFCMRRKAAPA